MPNNQKELDNRGLVYRIIGKFSPNLYTFKNVGEFLEKRHIVTPTPKGRYFPGSTLEGYAISILGSSTIYRHMAEDFGRIKESSGSLDVRLDPLEGKSFPILLPYKKAVLQNGLTLEKPILVYQKAFDQVWLAGFGITEKDIDRNDGGNSGSGGNQIRVYMPRPALA